MGRWTVVAVVVMLGLVPLAGCGGDENADDGPDGVRIAAFDFAESELLAEIYAQSIEARGVPVDRLGAIGPREIVAPALRMGEIDVVPEYVGTAAGHYGADGRDLASLRAAVEGFGLEALEPADAVDSNVFVVTAETARAQDLVRVSDLDEFAPTARFGGPVECPERPLCLLGLRDVYGLEFAEFVPQNSLVLTADALRRGEIDVGLLFSTSAALDEDEFVVLVDDKALQPPENVVPLVRADVLRERGSVVPAALDEVSASLTTTDLRNLNQRVEGGEAIQDVAASWLADVLNGA
jgi:osmoprotectant transport system substrate-binding protein